MLIQRLLERADSIDAFEGFVNGKRRLNLARVLAIQETENKKTLSSEGDEKTEEATTENNSPMPDLS